MLQTDRPATVSRLLSKYLEPPNANIVSDANMARTPTPFIRAVRSIILEEDGIFSAPADTVSRKDGMYATVTSVNPIPSINSPALKLCEIITPTYPRPIILHPVYGDWSGIF